MHVEILDFPPSTLYPRLTLLLRPPPALLLHPFDDESCGRSWIHTRITLRPQISDSSLQNQKQHLLPTCAVYSVSFAPKHSNNNSNAYQQFLGGPLRLKLSLTKQFCMLPPSPYLHLPTPAHTHDDMAMPDDALDRPLFAPPSSTPTHRNKDILIHGL